MNHAKIFNMFILTACFAALLSFSTETCAKERKESMLERKKIKDNKISIMTRFIYFPLKEIQKKNAIYRYDVNGNKNEILEYDVEGNVIKKTVFKYNEKSLETEYTEYDAFDSQLSRHENKYDKKDNITEELFYDKNNEITYKRICKYDAQDNLIENALFDKNNKNFGIWKFNYDNKGNKSEVSTYNATGKYNGKFSYIYNSNDDMLEMYTYDKTNKITLRNSYRFDQKNLMREAIVYNATGKPSSWKKYEYDYYKDGIAVSIKPSVKTEEVKVTPITAAVTLIKPALEPTVVAVSNPVEPNTSSENTEQQNIINSTPTEKEPVKKNFYEVSDLVRDNDYNKLKKLVETEHFDINEQNPVGFTLLMLAVYWGHEGTTKYLLENGANTELKDHEGRDVRFFLELTQKKNKNISEMINDSFKK